MGRYAPAYSPTYYRVGLVQGAGRANIFLRTQRSDGTALGSDLDTGLQGASVPAMPGEVDDPYVLVRQLVEDGPGIVAAAVVYDDDLEGVLVRSDDSGMTWRQARAPGLVQSECFASRQDGWVARGGTVWATHDAGRSWIRALPCASPSIWRRAKRKRCISSWALPPTWPPPAGSCAGSRNPGETSSEPITSVPGPRR